MYLIRVNDEEPIAVPLNAGLSAALEFFGLTCASRPNSNTIILMETTAEHAKPIVKRVLAFYDKEGIMQ